MNNIFNATPENIWNYRQNHPELVIKDLQDFNLPNYVQDVVRQSMLCRGINKWLKVRRDLIAYKKLIKHQILDLQKRIPLLKKELQENYVSITQVKNGDRTIDDFVKYENIVNIYLRAKDKLKMLEIIRRDLKAMCMTERWQIWQDKKIDEMNTIKASD